MPPPLVLLTTMSTRPNLAIAASMTLAAAALEEPELVTGVVPARHQALRRGEERQQRLVFTVRTAMPPMSRVIAVISRYCQAR